MFLRGLAMFAVVSIFGMGCGGTEVAAEVTEGTESGESLGQDSAALIDSCETLQTRNCVYDTSRGCQWANGAQGECYCQDVPFNKWFCWVND
ncbi:hypothetical protein [Corallococcus sicarius]|uniref:Lipoprotein n=1 Tax=Corallococcus sicarius TaxID=2316726 RepID=A0A3A8P0Q5_9BACT|nr:hypothetical protein [Corallococcus sicarius]RKH45962.1 hypothetical protein D7X12_06455 [Corallococcus sicarius]